MICPHCGKDIEVRTDKEIYTLFLEKWNAQGVIVHKKITSRMKKGIDRVLRNKDYTQEEIFTAFVNYGFILKSAEYLWNYKWTMDDFLTRGLHKFVDEAQPFDNKKNDKPKANNPYANFSCGGE